MFKSKRIVLTSLVVLFIGIITTSNFLNTRGVKANQSQTQQTTNTTQDNHFKRQPESDSVSGKTNDSHPHWSTNPTGEKYTTIALEVQVVMLLNIHFQSYDKSHNELGASYIEIDLQRTKDGHLVAMHDETVNRTTNGHGRVDHYTLKQLKQLDAGSWFNKANPKYANKNYKMQKYLR